MSLPSPRLVRLAAVVAVLGIALILAVRSRTPRVTLAVEPDPGGLLVRVRAPRAAVQVVLLNGPVWGGEDFFRPAFPGSSIHIPPDKDGIIPVALAERAIQAGEEVTALIPLETISEEWSALEVVARSPEDADGVLARSDTFVLRRDGARIDARRHLHEALRRNGAFVLVFYLGAVAAISVLRSAPAPRLRSRWPGFAAAGAALALLLAARITGPDPVRWLADASHYDAPLVWPGDWSLEDDGWERALGPGFRALVDAVRTERRAGDRLSIVIPEDGGTSFLRAAYLAAEVHDAEIRLADGGWPRGLGVFIDVPPDAEPIARTDAGALARTEGRQR